MPVETIMTVVRPTRAGGSRKGPVLVIRGRRRKVLTKFLKVAETVLREDIAERLRAERLNYNSLSLTQSATNVNYTSLVRLIARAQEVLAARG